MEISVACCTAGGLAVSSSHGTAWCTAANVGSAMLAADVRSLYERKLVKFCISVALLVEFCYIGFMRRIIITLIGCILLCLNQENDVYMC